MSSEGTLLSIRNLRILSALLLLWIVILAGIIVVLSVQNEPETITLSSSVGQVIEQPLTDFTLIANSGEPLQLSDLRGKYTLLTFGYTHCPDVCPTTLLEFRRVKQELGDAASGVNFVFVSVDPERDTPQVLDQYVRRFDPSFIGLQGDDAVLQTVKDEYGMIYALRENPDSGTGYLVEHTASKYLIDPEGKLIRIYSFTTDAREIARELRKML